MTYFREIDERFLSPEYWGVDIDDPNTFRNSQPRVYVGNGEQYNASLVLASCLEDILSSHSPETPLSRKMARFPAQGMRVPDGTVVIIDSESLSELVDENLLDAPSRAVDPSIDAMPSFLSMWRGNRGTSDYTGQGRGFGEEVAMYTDEHKMYTRMLRWGVVFSRQSTDIDATPSRRGRYAATWRLDQPAASSAGVVVPVKPETETLRPGVELPLEINRTQAQEEVATFHSAMRTIERIRAVEVVHVPEPH